MPGRHDGGWYGSSRQPESRLAEADCLHSASLPLHSRALRLSSSPSLPLCPSLSSFAFSTVSCCRPLTVTRLSPPLVPQRGSVRSDVSALVFTSSLPLSFSVTPSVRPCLGSSVSSLFHSAFSLVHPPSHRASLPPPFTLRPYSRGY